MFGLSDASGVRLNDALRQEIRVAVCHDILDFLFEFSALACFRQKLGDQFCNQCRGTVLRHRCSTNRSAINGGLDRLCAAGAYRLADWIAGLK